MQRSDQLREAETIFLLRALKSGKELSRLLEKWVHERPSEITASAVETIIVKPPQSSSSYFDVESGEVDRVPVQIDLISTTIAGTEAQTLKDAVVSSFNSQPFSGFGLDVDIQIVSRAEAFRTLTDTSLYEFIQGRRGSFTSKVDLPSDGPLPRLVTTKGLGRVIYGDRSSPLELARREAEKRVLISELALSEDTAELALRLDLPEAEVRRLLLEHGIDEAQQTFGIPIEPPLTGR
jgi:hypothetical protein